ncbi:trans-1,2-dihydrobenzene-1,2-diol dehydrogenase [Rhipicephalus sanguineus]|uniref:trans-1,2-dihydrobenzene-1,2-diol dehydrogenase n=1 Tax=Rhipicephalus sanguineus TaxID=34632 RepID=UPI0020C438B3|nr:trans-1,2-dihydrobenzene-1,2-diol dehydrogenase [Rhipicephalus sanguineus]
MAPTRWGIVAAGAICNDFVDCLNNLPRDEHQVVAVAGRNLDNAKKFAELHRISKVYSNYEDIAKDPDVDVAYIGSLHPDHYPTMKVLLENGKHILCEKPLTMNSRDTKDICRMAKEKKLFLMEALWSRYLPTYKHMEELLKNGTIGDVRYVHSTFGYPMENQSRMFSKELGGSVLLTLGNYCVNIVLQVFGGERPVKISACGDLSPQGTDKGVAVAMEFSGGRLATFALSGVVKLPGVAEIFGKKGKITVHPPFHAPSCVESPAGKFEIQFPQPSVPLNFPNSSGLRYEAEEVRRCLREGLLESPKMTHHDSLLIAEIFDEIFKQIGVQF